MQASIPTVVVADESNSKQTPTLPTVSNIPIESVLNNSAQIANQAPDKRLSLKAFWAERNEKFEKKQQENAARARDDINKFEPAAKRGNIGQ
jgi:hypothetical protein